MLKVLRLLLQQAIDAIDGGTCNLDEQGVAEVADIVQGVMSRCQRLSKCQACGQLHVSRATFDNYVRLGLIPRGKHTRGFKELSWSQEDIDKARAGIEQYRLGT